MYRYEPTPAKMGADPTKSGEKEITPTNYMGTPLAATVYRYWLAITPSGTPLAFIPDALVVTVDANVTMAPADSPGDTAVAIAMKAGIVQPFSPATVTVVSAGTCYALYTRKPS